MLSWIVCIRDICHQSDNISFTTVQVPLDTYLKTLLVSVLTFIPFALLLLLLRGVLVAFYRLGCHYYMSCLGPLDKIFQLLILCFGNLEVVRYDVVSYYTSSTTFFSCCSI